MAGGATFLLAVATLSVAYLTRKLAKATIKVAEETNRLAQETTKMVQQEDKHHRERFMPMCVLVRYTPIGSGTERGGVVSIKRDGMNTVLIIQCSVRNAGAGPALNILMRPRLLDYASGNGISREMSSIGAGQTEGDINTGILISIDAPAGIEWKGQTKVYVSHWEIDLEYTDVFGQKFVTTHTSDLNARWATFKKLGSEGEG